MVMVKISKSGTYIIDNDRVFFFGLSGRFEEEKTDILQGCKVGALQLPCISVLSSNGVTDIGVVDSSGNFARYESSLSSIECAMKLQSLGNFLRLLRREGTQSNIPYNQLIFVYKEGTDLASYLNVVNARECKL